MSVETLLNEAEAKSTGRKNANLQAVHSLLIRMADATEAAGVIAPRVWGQSVDDGKLPDGFDPDEVDGILSAAGIAAADFRQQLTTLLLRRKTAREIDALIAEVEGINSEFAAEAQKLGEVKERLAAVEKELAAAKESYTNAQNRHMDKQSELAALRESLARGAYDKAAVSRFCSARTAAADSAEALRSAKYRRGEMNSQIAVSSNELDNAANIKGSHAWNQMDLKLRGLMARRDELAETIPALQEAADVAAQEAVDAETAAMAGEVTRLGLPEARTL